MVDCEAAAMGCDSESTISLEADKIEITIILDMSDGKRKTGLPLSNWCQGSLKRNVKTKRNKNNNKIKVYHRLHRNFHRMAQILRVAGSNLVSLQHNTIKILIGITPNGHISFLSKAYGGWASGVHIVCQSGFLSLIGSNDALMADRGFPIQEDLMLYRATLEIPPAAQGNRQMTREKVQKTQTLIKYSQRYFQTSHLFRWGKLLI